MPPPRDGAPLRRPPPSVLAVGVEHFGIAGIDGHDGTDGGLSQVHRRDVAALKMRQRLRQFALERSDEIATGGGGRGGGPLAAVY